MVSGLDTEAFGSIFVDVQYCVGAWAGGCQCYINLAGGVAPRRLSSVRGTVVAR